MKSASAIKIVILFCIIVMQQSFAQAGDIWKKLNLPGNETVFNIYSDGNGFIYAMRDQGGIFRSTDNGESWESLNLQGV